MPGPSKYIIDETKNRYGHLVVLKRTESIRGSAAWLCRCDCGYKTKVTGTNLRAGHVTTCGRECKFYTSSGWFDVGHRPTRWGDDYIAPKRIGLYNTWDNMNRRCYNTKNKDYEHYGARGIKVYPKWRKKQNDHRNYFHFRKYILKHLGKRPKGMTLDRINNGVGYFPGNLRWATNSQQNKNRRPFIRSSKHI